MTKTHITNTLERAYKHYRAQYKATGDLAYQVKCEKLRNQLLALYDITLADAEVEHLNDMMGV